MCSYNITLSDTLVEKIRPTFADDKALEQWLQQQMEDLLLNLYLRQETRNRARKAIAAMRQQSENNGNSEMTLEEINAEIRQARLVFGYRKPKAFSEIAYCGDPSRDVAACAERK